MRISKSNKTSITASIDSDIAKYKKSLEAKAAKSGVYENFGSAEIKKLQDKYSELPDDTTDYATAEHNRRAISSFEDWCMNYVGASTSTDRALQHIKAAIDILGKSGNKDAVTKDSIANLATVMFDIKGSTVVAVKRLSADGLSEGMTIKDIDDGHEFTVGRVENGERPNTYDVYDSDDKLVGTYDNALQFERVD